MIQPRLTAYLDGELADDHGSVVRGHLRECAACRQRARDEAVLRDGLRVLPPVDPPATLWAGVQAQLAAAEVADAHKPRWRRTVVRWVPWAWGRWAPAMPQLAAGALAAATAVAVLYWRGHRADELPSHVADIPVPDFHPHHQEPSVPAAVDVTADLIGDPARATASYAQVIEELMKLARETRSGWADERRAGFDARVAVLRDGITRAQGRSQQRAQRALIRYLQGAVVRDDVVLASGGTR